LILICRFDAGGAGLAALCVMHAEKEKRPVTSIWRDPDVLVGTTELGLKAS
jgi:hypothetical protein